MTDTRRKSEAGCSLGYPWQEEGCRVPRVCLAGPPNTRGQYNLSPSVGVPGVSRNRYLPAWGRGEEVAILTHPQAHGHPSEHGCLWQRRSHDQSTRIPRYSVKGLNVESAAGLNSAISVHPALLSFLLCPSHRMGIKVKRGWPDGSAGKGACYLPILVT